MSTPNHENATVGLLKKVVAGILAVILCLVVWNNFFRKRSVAELAETQDNLSQSGSDSVHSQSSGWEIKKLVDSEAMAQSTGHTPLELSKAIPEANQDQDSSGSAETGEPKRLDIEEIVLLNPFARSKKPKLVLSQNAESSPFSQSSNSGSEVTASSIQSDKLPIDPEQTSAKEPDTVTPPPIAKFTAIVTGGKRPAALIDDRIVYENDQIGDSWRIREIHTDGILLELVP